jgi:N-acetyl sugar amidotransferase
MDDSDPDICFDVDGVCQYVHVARYRLAEDVYRGTDAESRLASIVANVKTNGAGKPYDSIVGVSGGVDSSYVLLRARQLGLRPLAVHLDNGWNNELAVSNIEHLVRHLDIDLYTHVVDWPEIRDLQRCFFKASLPNVEVVTDHAIFALLYKKAAEYGLKYILTGSNVVTESIMPAAWGYDARDAIHIIGVHRMFGNTPLRTFPLLPPREFLRYALMNGIKMIPIINHGPYNKAVVVAELSAAVGYKPYQHKHGESRFTRFFQEYYLPRKFGFDKRKAHYSSLIVAGQMSRDAALAELNKPLYREIEAEIDLEYVIKKLGFTPSEWADIMIAPLQSFRAFPNRAWMFDHSSPLVLAIRAFVKGEYSLRKWTRAVLLSHPPPFRSRGTRHSKFVDGTNRLLSASTVSVSGMRNSTILHAHYSRWEHESRAWRAGKLTLDEGFGSRVVYVGHLSDDLAPEQDIDPRQHITRLPPALTAVDSPRSARIIGLPEWSWRTYRRWSADPSIVMIQCHGLASLPLCVALKRKLGVPLLYDAHELETERQGWSRKIKLVARVVERSLIGQVDHTIVVGESILDWYKARYPRRPISLVRNIPSVSSSSRSQRSLRKEAGVPPDELLCVYLGVLSPARGIPELIETFKRLPKTKHIAFVGFGDCAEMAQEAARIQSNIHFFEGVPPNEVIGFVSDADLGVIFLVSEALSYRFAMPNKMFEYANAGLAILCNDGTDMKAFVEMHRLGWVFDGTVEGAVRRLATLDSATVRALAAEPKPDLPSWESESRTLADILQRLLKNGG